jgi:hypothetical protein
MRYIPIAIYYTKKFVTIIKVEVCTLTGKGFVYQFHQTPCLLRADKFAIGRRSFERRFKKATSNTGVEYKQRVKIEAAKRSFERSRKNINEVCLMWDILIPGLSAVYLKKLLG